MRTFWLARHANREDFVDPDWADSADRPHDPDLSPDGIVQARQLAARVAALGPDGIVASPFLRAVHTAQHAAEQADLPIHLEPGLGEWANPNWFDAAPEPLPPAELAARFDRVAPSVDGTCRTPSFPESKAEALTRLADVARCLADRYADASLLLVGHGITVQGVLQGLVGDVPDPGCPLASLTTVEERGGTWHLARRNATDHLAGGPDAAQRMA